MDIQRGFGMRKEMEFKNLFWRLTSYIQPIVTGKLGERGHVVGVVGQLVGLFSDAAGSLLDTIIVGVLRQNKYKKKRLETNKMKNLESTHRYNIYISAKKINRPLHGYFEIIGIGR